MQFRAALASLKECRNVIRSIRTLGIHPNMITLLSRYECFSLKIEFQKRKHHIYLTYQRTESTIYNNCLKPGCNLSIPFESAIQLQFIPRTSGHSHIHMCIILLDTDFSIEQDLILPTSGYFLVETFPFLNFTHISYFKTYI